MIHWNWGQSEPVLCVNCSPTPFHQHSFTEVPWHSEALWATAHKPRLTSPGASGFCEIKKRITAIQLVGLHICAQSFLPLCWYPNLAFQEALGRNSCHYPGPESWRPRKGFPQPDPIWQLPQISFKSTGSPPWLQSLQGSQREESISSMTNLKKSAYG